MKGERRYPDGWMDSEYLKGCRELYRDGIEIARICPGRLSDPPGKSSSGSILILWFDGFRNQAEAELASADAIKAIDRARTML